MSKKIRILDIIPESMHDDLFTEVLEEMEKKAKVKNQPVAPAAKKYADIKSSSAVEDIVNSIMPY